MDNLDYLEGWAVALLTDVRVMQANQLDQKTTKELLHNIEVDSQEVAFFIEGIKKENNYED